MSFFLHCQKCNSNVLEDGQRLKPDEGIDLPGGILWRPPDVLRECPKCHALVRLFQHHSGKCMRWGPFKWIGAEYCNNDATVVKCEQRHFSDGIHINVFCEQHRDEQSLLREASSFRSFMVASAGLGLIGNRFAVLYDSSLSSPTVIIATAGFAAVPLLFMLFCHFRIKRDQARPQL